MTENEIIKGNKFIAEFYMAKLNDKYIMPFEPFVKYKLVDLKYHSSWDWLMPVVEKIESTYPLGGVCMIQQGMCRITSRMLGDHSMKSQNDNYLLMGPKGKLLSTYQSVVEFIKWYNNVIIKINK